MYENMYSRWLRNAHQIDLYDFYYGDSDKKEKEEEPEGCPYSGCPGTVGKNGYCDKCGRRIH